MIFKKLLEKLKKLFLFIICVKGTCLRDSSIREKREREKERNERKKYEGKSATFSLTESYLMIKFYEISFASLKKIFFFSSEALFGRIIIRWMISRT